LAALLLARGANPNLTIDGWSPLHQLVATSNPPMHLLPGAVPTGKLTALQLADRLIAQNADINGRVTKPIDDESSGRSTVGATPLFIAATRLDAMMIRFLLSNGANQEIAAGDGTTPLMAAAGVVQDNRPDDADPEPRLAAVKILIEHGGDVNSANNKNESALHGAARRGSTEVAQLLIERGARLDQKTKFGLTPLAIAEGKECEFGCRDGLTGVVRPEVAKALRQAMQERNMPIEDIKPVNVRGNQGLE
jgi:ankyrin repeat protein